MSSISINTLLNDIIELPSASGNDTYLGKYDLGEAFNQVYEKHVILDKHMKPEFPDDPYEENEYLDISDKLVFQQFDPKNPPSKTIEYIIDSKLTLSVVGTKLMYNGKIWYDYTTLIKRPQSDAEQWTIDDVIERIMPSLK
jgi:hypothetical protein